MRPFYEIWSELEGAGFFSLSTSIFIEKKEHPTPWDDLCQELVDENGFLSTRASFFERNLDITVVGDHKETKFHVSSSRPFWSADFGVGKSSYSFYGSGATFDDAVRDLHGNFTAKANAVKCKPLNYISKNGVKTVSF